MVEQKNNLLFTAPEDLITELSIVRRENIRLNTLAAIQKKQVEAELNNALPRRLGQLLIQGVSSPKAFLALPYTLCRTWYAATRVVPPHTLGGKGFSAVIAAYIKEGMPAVETLLESAGVASEMRANAYTALAKSIKGMEPEMTAEIAELAWKTDPRPYRMKWWAFCLNNAEKVIEAEAVLSALPEGTVFSASESRLMEKIRIKARYESQTLVHDDPKESAPTKTSAKAKTKTPSKEAEAVLPAQPWLAAKVAHIKHRLQKYIPRKGYSSYTIVSACYNVAPYLDDYFNSLVNQTLSFKKNIYCIMVDDGSTDETAQIIKKWQNKYPTNIKYIYKKNGGASSARNAGLSHINTPWVTFTDPDDFLEKDYFDVIDKYLQYNKSDICMLSANIYKFFEENKHIEPHILSHIFKSKYNKYIVKNLDNNIKLQAASAFFQTEHIIKHKIVFPEDCKPSFEDAHFILNYLKDNQEMCAVFLKDALYYYRKREAKNSLVDTMVFQKDRFFSQLKYGHLDIIQKYTKQHIKPSYLYMTIIYDTFWIIKPIINNPESIDFLSTEEKENFFSLLQEIYSLINTEYIYNSFSTYNGIWFYYQVGLITCLKNKLIDVTQRVYIEQYDAYKDEVELRYFTGEIGEEIFLVDEVDSIPTHAKTVRDDFCGHTFVLQRRLWVPLSGHQNSAQLTVIINGKQSSISFQGKVQRKVLAGDIRCALSVPPSKNDSNSPYDNCWLFVDRETQADDNAEHLYRYVKRNHPEINAWFVVIKHSSDWQRLVDEGANVISMYSEEHDLALERCSKIISSHFDESFMCYSDKTRHNKPYFYLDHGIIKDDSSSIYNKKNFKLFLTATPAQWASICGENTRFKFSKKEVKCLGLPRHDALLQNDEKQQRSILIMPTWRRYIDNRLSQDKSNMDEIFLSSNYFIFWNSFLCNKRLYDITTQYGFNAVFFPHFRMQQYFRKTIFQQNIQIMSFDDIAIQKLFKRSSVLITDYSSVAFEMAYLQRPVIYYQFDEKEFYAGHTGHFHKGYFDHREHGFGPVVTDENALFAELEKLLIRDCVPEPLYAERMNTTFAYHDQNNCARVFHAICEIEKPYPEDYVNIDILRDYARMASKGTMPKIALSRAQRLNSIAPDDESLQLLKEAQYQLACAQQEIPPRKILCVFGTRTEAVRMVTIIKALKLDNNFETKVCLATQHQQALNQILDFFAIVPEYNIDLMQAEQTLPAITTQIQRHISEIFEQWKPDLVLVHGATTTTFSASLAALYSNIKVAHLGSELRCEKPHTPCPEEVHRKVADSVADIHFVPTNNARDNLLKEGVQKANIHVTGSTAIDTLLNVASHISTNDALRLKLEKQFSFLDSQKKCLLVACQHHESSDQSLENICHALADIALRGDVQIVWAVHNTSHEQETVQRILGLVPSVFLLEPLDYLPFVYLMMVCTLVLTDSGGIQEEAPSLGKPVLFLSETTERPEAVKAGITKLVGKDRVAIVREANFMLGDSAAYLDIAHAHNPYGDGRAAERIKTILKGIRDINVL